MPLTVSECLHSGAVKHMHINYKHFTELGDIGTMSAFMFLIVLRLLLYCVLVYVGENISDI